MQKIISALLTFTLLCTVTASAVKADAVTETMGIPDVISEAAVLMDATNGQILFQKNMDQKMYPASITKIITGMLALEKGNLSDKITMSYDAVFSVDRNSSHIALDVGEELTLEQALYAMSIESANDAANGIAELIGGSIENFVKIMNDTAVKAGAKNTNFINANGLCDNKHYTTAYDMAKITAAAIKTSGFAKIFSAEQYEIPPTNKQPQTRIFSSRNKLINGEVPYEGILISKSGWTEEAQHTLVTVAQKNGTTLIAVVMKSPNQGDKWKDTTTLLDYGFEKFSPITLTKEKLIQSAPKKITATDNKLINTAFTASGDVSLLIPVNMTADDISITYGTPAIDATNNLVQLPVYISLKKSYSSSMPPEIMNITLSSRVSSAKNKAVASSDNAAEKNSEKKGGGLLILTIAALGTIVYFVMRRRCRAKRRRHSRKNRY